MPEAEAKMINNPKTKSTTTIGISHQSLRCHKNDNSSLTTPKLEPMLRKKFFILSIPFYLIVFCSNTNQPEYNRKRRNYDPISEQQNHLHTAYQYRYFQMYSTHL